MSFTLRQLEVFVLVAETSHFGRAAERLHSSQPMVSQEVRRLERALGVSLFDRTTRTVHLTAAGEALLDEARAVRFAVRDFASRAERSHSERSRRLRIAVTPSVLDEILPVILRRAEWELPDTELAEVAVETGEVGDALEHRGCDVGLGRFVAAPPGYRSEEIRRERVLVALSSQHEMAGRSRIGLAGMGDLPLLLWPREQNPAYHDWLMEICGERGLEPLLLVSPSRIVGGRSYLIADGRAFSLIPESTRGRLSTGIRALPLAEPAYLPMSAVWMERDTRPLVADFLKLAREVGTELTPARP